MVYTKNSLSSAETKRKHLLAPPGGVHQVHPVKERISLDVGDRRDTRADVPDGLGAQPSGEGAVDTGRALAESVPCCLDYLPLIHLFLSPVYLGLHYALTSGAEC